MREEREGEGWGGVLEGALEVFSGKIPVRGEFEGGRERMSEGDKSKREKRFDIF